MKILVIFKLGLMLMVIMGVMVVKVMFIIIGRWMLKKWLLKYWISVVSLVVNKLVLIISDSLFFGKFSVVLRMSGIII